MSGRTRRRQRRTRRTPHPRVWRVEVPDDQVFGGRRRLYFMDAYKARSAVIAYALGGKLAMEKRVQARHACVRPDWHGEMAV